MKILKAILVSLCCMISAQASVTQVVNNVKYVINGNVLDKVLPPVSGTLTLDLNNVSYVAPHFLWQCVDQNITKIVIGKNIRAFAYDYWVKQYPADNLPAKSYWRYTPSTLDEIQVQAGNTNFQTIDGVLYSASLDRLVRCPPRRIFSEVPSSVGKLQAFAFANCTQLQNIILTPGVGEIGSSAFEGCSNLTNIVLNTGMKTIPHEAFRGCVSLKTIALPDTIEILQRGAFGISGLTQIQIPHSVTNLDECFGAGWIANPFSWSSNLVSIIVAEDNPRYKSVNGSVYNKDGTEVICCAPGCTNFQVAVGTETIRERAFAGCSLLKKVDLLGTIAEIEDYAFKNCSELESVVGCQSVRRIGDSSFGFCKLLGEIMFENTITNIGLNCFVECSKLTNVWFEGGAPNNAYTVSYIYSGSSTAVTHVKRSSGGWESFLECGEWLGRPLVAYGDVWSTTPFGTNGLKRVDIGEIVEITAPDPVVVGASTQIVFTGSSQYQLTDNRIEVEVENDMCIHWDICQTNFWIGLDLPSTGSLVGTEGWTAAGQEIVLTATPPSGLAVDAWLGDVEGCLIEGNTLHVPMTKARRIGVAFDLPRLSSPNLLGDATFVNPSHTITLSCATEGATILYTTDGSDPAENGRVYKRPLEVYKTTTVKAVAVKDDWKNSEVVEQTFTKADAMSEASGLFGYAFDNDVSAAWTADTVDGQSCVKSGAITRNGTTTLVTSVKKAGTISFWWRASCEEPDPEDGADGYYDYASFAIGGEVVARLAGHDTGWQFFSTNITTGGKHVLEWTYQKDGATDYAPDCLWVNRIQWNPADGSGKTLTTPEPVPYAWLTKYGLFGDGDFEAAAFASTGKTSGGSPLAVWQDYVAGTDPTNRLSEFSARIEMREGVPLVKWKPDLNEDGTKNERLYTVWGSATLSPPAWHSPTNADDRFFKVTVEMP